MMVKINYTNYNWYYSKRAESEGFEPSVPLQVHMLSKHAP